MEAVKDVKPRQGGGKDQGAQQEISDDHCLYILEGIELNLSYGSVG